MPVGVSAYVPLANVTLSGSAASVTFSSISQAYRDLVLVANTVQSGNQMEMRFNGSATTIYFRVNAEGVGSSTYSQAVTDDRYAPGQYVYGNAVNITNIFDYSITDKHKSILTRYGGSSTGVNMSAGRWASTSAITSIELFATFAAGSTFALYGVSA